MIFCNLKELCLLVPFVFSPHSLDVLFWFCSLCSVCFQFGRFLLTCPQLRDSSSSVPSLPRKPSRHFSCLVKESLISSSYFWLFLRISISMHASHIWSRMLSALFTRDLSMLIKAVLNSNCYSSSMLPYLNRVLTLALPLQTVLLLFSLTYSWNSDMM